MKRVMIIGAIGVAAVAILLVGVALGVMVTPVRAQIGQVFDQALSGLQVEAVQAQAQAPGLQLKAEKGILVAGIFQDSPADKAGLVRGDIITQVDGTAVNSDADLRNILSQHKVGDSLKLTVQHGDSQKSVTVTLAESPAAQQTTPQSGQQNNRPNSPRGSFLSSPFLGIIPLGSGQFGGKGVVNGQPGARIGQVATGSPAEKAGLKVGEVIRSVDGTQIGPQNPLTTLIGNHKPGDSVKLSVQGTDGAQRTVTVTLGDNPQKAGTAYLGVSTGGFGRGFGFGFPGGRGNPNPRNFQGLAQHPGAYIEQVTQNSPAEKAGIKTGEVIESVDGKKLDSAQVLSDTIAAHKPGDKVTLSVYDPQANKTSDVQLTLGDNPQKAGSAWMGIQYGYFNMPNMPTRPTPGASGTNF